MWSKSSFRRWVHNVVRKSRGEVKGLPIRKQTRQFTRTIESLEDRVVPSTLQNFDGVVAPALPAGWNSIVIGGAPNPWTTNTAASTSAPNSAVVADPAGVTDNALVTPVFTATTDVPLTFQNRFNVEPGFDGGVLEISINGGGWTDILAAGGTFNAGGYTGTISTSFSNPLGGRSAWTGTSAGFPAFLTTSVNLPTAANGQPVQLRWRMGTDTSNVIPSFVEWRIDNVVLPTAGLGLNAAGQLVFTDTSAGPGVNDDVRIQFDTLNGRYIITNSTPMAIGGVAGATGNGTTTVTVPFGSIPGNGIIINTGAGSDSLTIDYTLGFTNIPINYNGGVGGQDDLVVTGGLATAVTHTLDSIVEQAPGSPPVPPTTPENAGSVQVDARLITYTNLEPVADFIITPTRVINYDNLAQDVLLHDPGAAGSNAVRIEAPGTEAITFTTVGLSSLTVNLGDGNDRMRIRGLEASFNANILVFGQGGDDRLLIDYGAGQVREAIQYDGGGGGGQNNTLAFGTVGVLPPGTFGPNMRESYYGTGEDAGTHVVDPDGGAGPGAGVPFLYNGDETTVVFTNTNQVETELPSAFLDVVLNSLSDWASLDNATLDIDPTQPPPAVAAHALRDRRPLTQGTFADLVYANKPTVRINGYGGADAIQLNATINAAGLNKLELYGHLAPDIIPLVPLVLEDNASDLFQINATTAPITNFFGQGGSDLFFNADFPPFMLPDFPIPAGPVFNGQATPSSGNFDMSNIVGTVTIDGGEGALAVHPENFDGVPAGTLPVGWSTVGDGLNPWTTIGGIFVSPPNSASTGDPGFLTDNSLVSPTFIPTAGTPLTFQNRVNVENGFDGGVLEISSPNINNGVFTDILAAGGSFNSGGYNGTLGGTSPLAGQAAWTGFLGGFFTTSVNLPAAAAGQTVQLRWRMTTDFSVAGAGWQLDDIVLPGDYDLINLHDSAAAGPDQVTLTSTQLTGAAPATINYTGVEGFLFESTQGDDTIDVLSTAAGTNYMLSGNGGNDTITIGNTKADYGTVFDGSLDAILGPVAVSSEFNGPDGIDTLNVDDSGTASLAANPTQAASIGINPFYSFPLGVFGGIYNPPSLAGASTDLLGFAGTNNTDTVPIRYFHSSFGFVPGNLMENLNVQSSQGDDTIFVFDTTATQQTTLDTREGNDDVTIFGDNLSANNLFKGHTGNDKFTLNIFQDIGATSFWPIAGVEIQGNDPAATTTDRDSVTINDFNPAGRALDYTYVNAGFGDVDIAPHPTFPLSGLFGPAPGALPLRIRTTETVVFNDLTGANNDLVRVFGTTQDDILTIGLQTNNTSAAVFIDGKPYLDTTEAGSNTATPPRDSMANSRPGVSGGSPGPDILITGIDPVTGISADGGGAGADGDRLVIYAGSENGLVDPATPDIFGQGPGVLLPAFGAGQAYDTINVTDAVVTTVNNFYGQLTTVNINAASFVQAPPNSQTQRPALIVNGGDEDVAAANGIADFFTVTISTVFNIQINGNLPLNSLAPNGDALVITTPLGPINVCSDGSIPPNVIVGGIGGFAIRFTSIERLTLVPGNGIINIIGDNCGANPNQADYFVIRGVDVDGNGEGVNEFTLRLGTKLADGTINLGSVIFVNGVSRINAVGGGNLSFDANGNVSSDGSDTAVDTLDIAAYADNTPRGWGIETYFNEGGPVLDGDLLIVGGVDGVSDTITIQPSSAQNGQVFSTNAATGTPIAVINYLLNTSVIVNSNPLDPITGLPENPAAVGGALGDTDTLTLRGTNPASPANVTGNDTFDIDLTRTGLVSQDWIQVTDGVAPIYSVQKFTGFATLNIATLNGSDTVSVIGALDGGVTFNVDGGPSDAGLNPFDKLVMPGVADADDVFAVYHSVTPGTATVVATRSGSAPTTVNLVGTEQITVDGGAGAGADTVGVFGTNAADVIELVGTGPASGTVSVGTGPQVVFSDLGNTASQIDLNAGNGDDQISLYPATDWNLATVNVNAGDGTDRVDVLGTGNGEKFTYEASAFNVATLKVTTATTTTFNLNSTNSVSLNARAPVNGSLEVTTKNAVVIPGADPGSGIVRPVDANSQSLLELEYRHLASVTVTGDAAVVQGTAENDTITVPANGKVSVTNLFGFNNTVDVSGFKSLVINPHAGDDAITVVSSGLFSGGIRIVGGEPGAGSDSLTVTTTAGQPNVTVDFATNKVTGVVQGAIELDGVETVAINGLDGTANAFAVLGYGSVTDVRTLNLNGGDTDNDDADQIDMNLKAGHGTIDFTAISPSAATLGGIGGPTVNITGLNSALQSLQVNGAAGTYTANVNGTSFNDLFTLSDVGGTNNVEQKFNGVTTWVQLNLVSFAGVNVFGNQGIDTLTIDEANGLVFEGGHVTYDGGAGRDVLRLENGTAVAATYDVGPAADAGTVTHVGVGGTQRVFFNALEPVIDLVPGTLTVNGTTGSNAITYAAGVAADGKVTVDGFESYEFSNKTALTINAGSGNDAVTVANAGIATPVTVNGGAGTDSLTVVGTAAADAVNYTPAGTDGGSVAGIGGTITFATSEGLNYVGQGGGDTLTVTGPAGGSEITFTPGATADAGSVDMLETGAGALVPIDFSTLGTGSTLTFATTGGGRVSTLDVLGTAGDDSMTVAATGNVTLLSAALDPLAPTITTPGINFLQLTGLSGDDTMTVAGNHPFAGGVSVQGGDPAEGDTLDFVGSGGAVAVSLTDHTVTEGANGAVAFSGVSDVNVDGANADVVVTGTAGDDTVAVTPAGAGAGSFTATAAPGVDFAYTATTSFTVNGGAGGFDTLSVLGNGAANTVTSAASAVTVDGGTVTAGTDLDLLDLQTFGGADNITLAAFTALPTRISSGDGADVVVGSPQADLIFGGEGNDSINGGAGVDTLYGQGGNDALDGDQGNDQAFGGDGSDTFTWDPGDGSDLFEGDQGVDVLRFNGAGAAEVFTLNAVGSRVEFLRDLGGIDMDLGGVEQLDLNALGGSDTITINDMTGTDLRVANINLGADGATDTVNVNGTAGADNLSVASAGTTVSITGMALSVNIPGAEAADLLNLNTAGGDDSVTLVNPVDTAMLIAVAGGPGSDRLDLSGLTGPRTINLQTDSVTGLNGVTGIESFVGTTAADTLIAEDTANTIHLTGANAGTVTNLNGPVAFAGIENLTGGTADDRLEIGAAGALSGSFNGAAGSDTVVGPDRNNVWNVTGANAGSVAGVAFSNTENLQGNSQDDRFVFAAAASVAGTVSGGSGADALNYAAYVTPVAIDLEASTATGTGGFDGIESAIGGAAADTLTGTNDASTWNVATANAGTVGGFGFSSFENLNGGTADDNFEFAYGANITGALNGGGGFDTVTQLGNGAANTVNASPTGVTIDGFTVPAGASIEAIAVNTLGGNDTINLAQGTNLTVDAGAGTDTINVDGNAGVSDAFTVTQGANPVSGAVTAVGGLGVSAPFTDVEQLNLNGGGGAAADSLALIGTDAPDAFTANATAGAAAGTAVVNAGTAIGFSNFGTAGSSLSMSGLGGNDSFSVAQAGNWGIGTVNIDGGPSSFEDTASVTGTAAADAFAWTPSTGTLVVTPAASTPTTYNLTEIQTAQIDGAAPATIPGDTLLVTEPNPFVVPSPIPVNNGPPVIGSTNLLYKNVEGIQIDQFPVAVNDTVNVVEDTATDISVLANDTGIGNTPLTLTIVTQPVNGTLTLVNNPGTAPFVRYTPKQDYNGPDSFTYRVTDVNAETSNVATVNITVTPVNDPPVAVDDAFTAIKNQVLTVPPPGVLANDTDVDNTPAQLSAAVTQQGTLGVVAMNANGGFTYTPNPNVVGVDTFKYQVTDAAGGKSNIATVTVTIPGLGGVGPGGANSVVVAGSDSGAAPATVRVFQASNGVVQNTLRPFGGFAGGVRVANGDFNNDGTPDIAYGSGPGMVARVQVIDGKTGATMFDTQPFEAQFTGGVFVAAGDINADGFRDLVITPDVTGGPRVRVFSGKTFTPMADFFGITDPNFRGGARAAIGDINGDGYGDITVAAGFGGGPRVAFFNGKNLPTKLFNDIFVFEQTLRNGVFVASGDLDGDGFADLTVGGGPGGAPRVMTLSGKGMLPGGQESILANFFAGDPEQRGGIRVSIANLDNDNRADLVVGSGSGPHTLVTGYFGKDFPIRGAAPEKYALDAFPELETAVFVG